MLHDQGIFIKGLVLVSLWCFVFYNVTITNRGMLLNDLASFLQFRSSLVRILASSPSNASSGVARPPRDSFDVYRLLGATGNSQSSKKGGIKGAKGNVTEPSYLLESLWKNPHPFKYILNTENVCKEVGKPLFLLIFVHTAPGNYKRRMMIRQTWGDFRYFLETPIRRIFVTGKSGVGWTNYESALRFESDQYSDIVQEDFVDTYRNLTYKGIAALRWIYRYCNPKPLYVLKTDDDVFVNMFVLVTHLKSLMSFQVSSSVSGSAEEAPRNFLLCYIFRDTEVMTWGKWKVTKDEYPLDRYPNYCGGLTYVMSTDVAIAMYNLSFYVPFFWVDDAYFTGILAKQLGIVHQDFNSKYEFVEDNLERTFTSNRWTYTVFAHVQRLNSVQAVWNNMLLMAKKSNYFVSDEGPIVYKN